MFSHTWWARRPDAAAAVVCILAFHAAGQDGKNRALYKSVQCSCRSAGAAASGCTSTGSSADLMTDGSSATAWVSGQDKDRYACVLDLGQSVRVGKVRLKYQNGNVAGLGQSRTCSKWNVLTSDYNAGFTSVTGWGGMFDNMGRTEDVLVKDGGVSARFLQFVCNQLNSVDVQIAEWEVFEAAVQPTSSPTAAATLPAVKGAPASSASSTPVANSSADSSSDSDGAGSNVAAVLIGVGAAVALLLLVVVLLYIKFAGGSSSRIAPAPSPAQPHKPGDDVEVADVDAYYGDSHPELLREISDEMLTWTVRPVSGRELEALRAFMHVPDPQNLGIGRDVKEKERYKSLQLVYAWKVSKPNKRPVYEAKKQQVESDMRLAGKVMPLPIINTKLDAVAAQLGVDDSVNEKILLHGTKPEIVLTILQNGLNERLSGGLFGSGSYLAEDPSKIDQYCTPDQGLGSGDKSVEVLHDKLYRQHDLNHPGRVFYCFATRVVLGIPVYTKDGEVNMNPPGQNVWLTGDKRELVTVPETIPPVHYHTLIAECGQGHAYKVKRHREFVTFSGDRTLIEYVIAYRRVK